MLLSKAPRVPAMGPDKSEGTKDVNAPRACSGAYDESESSDGAAKSTLGSERAWEAGLRC